MTGRNTAWQYTTRATCPTCGQCSSELDFGDAKTEILTRARKNWERNERGVSFGLTAEVPLPWTLSRASPTRRGGDQRQSSGSLWWRKAAFVGSGSCHWPIAAPVVRVGDARRPVAAITRGIGAGCK